MERGAHVVLITGETSIEKPSFVNIVNVTSAADMFEAVKTEAFDADFVIKAAAVADYTPVNVSNDKMKKNDDDMSIPLKHTVDILKYLGEHKKEGQILCGFAMETKDLIENARKKLESKNADLIVANNVKVEGAGFGTDTNVVTFIEKEGVS